MWKDLENNFQISCLFSSILELKVLFARPASYKDELGKILYVVVVMNFLNTNGSIVSFGKKNLGIKDGGNLVLRSIFELDRGWSLCNTSRAGALLIGFEERTMKHRKYPKLRR